MGAWLALAALLLNSLLPFAAPAKPQSDRSFVLCTAHGVQVIAIDAESSAPFDSKSVPGAHCPLCSGGGVAVFVTTPGRLFEAPEIVGALSYFDRSSPRAASAIHPAAPPRGPPSPV